MKCLTCSTQMKCVNDLRKATGKLLLNDILNLLYLPRMAANVGWDCDATNSDGYIDFIVDWKGNSVIIDFNVDGLIEFES